jgi:hypothetical protein
VAILTMARAKTAKVVPSCVHGKANRNGFVVWIEDPRSFLGEDGRTVDLISDAKHFTGDEAGDHAVRFAEQHGYYVSNKSKFA